MLDKFTRCSTWKLKNMRVVHLNPLVLCTQKQPSRLLWIKQGELKEKMKSTQQVPLRSIVTSTKSFNNSYMGSLKVTSLLFSQTNLYVFVSLTQLIQIMQTVCKVWGSNPSQKKKKTILYKNIGISFKKSCADIQQQLTIVKNLAVVNYCQIKNVIFMYFQNVLYVIKAIFLNLFKIKMRLSSFIFSFFLIYYHIVLVYRTSY